MQSWVQLLSGPRSLHIDGHPPEQPLIDGGIGSGDKHLENVLTLSRWNTWQESMSGGFVSLSLTSGPLALLVHFPAPLGGINERAGLFCVHLTQSLFCTGTIDWCVLGQK